MMDSVHLDVAALREWSRMLDALPPLSAALPQASAVSAASVVSAAGDLAAAGAGALASVHGARLHALAEVVAALDHRTAELAGATRAALDGYLAADADAATIVTTSGKLWPPELSETTTSGKL
jgi:hypothetical protein